MYSKNKQVEQWVELALVNEDLSPNYGVTSYGNTNRDDGYLSTIDFVRVEGTSKDGTKKVHDLAIKSSKQSEKLRNFLPLREAFIKEIYIYKTVASSFNKFQLSKGFEMKNSLLDFMVYYYGSEVKDTNELLILRSLKPEGYFVWNRKIPMPYKLVEIILEAYGRLHALSLSLKDHDFEEYKRIKNENEVNLFSVWMKQGGLLPLIFKLLEAAKATIIDEDKKDKILNSLDISLEKVEYYFIDLFYEDPEDHVILHGDCWTNNFLFKTEDNLPQGNPLDVKIIDWQMSAFGSPVFDLSLFIYSCCSKEDYKDFENLLNIYYTSLSETLVKLGSNPEVIFPFAKLKQHWKKYSAYGLLLSLFLLKFSLCEAEDAPDLAEAAESGVNVFDDEKFFFSNAEEYTKRVKDNLLHYYINTQ